MRRLSLIVAGVCAVGVASGQTWNEDGDAAALLPGQTTVGTGPLTQIVGTLTTGSDADLFAIYINDEANFSASTVGGTSIDSALYLFDENGNGIAMSEDAGGVQSTITSTFVTANGVYYLAMSAYDYDPLNSGGLEIWNDAPWNLERAPDGPGAPGPLAGWGGSAGGSGNYIIFLTGATFKEQGPPPPTGACCFADGHCQVLTVSGCTGLGGTYQGDNTTCDPNPCPPPLKGACCFATSGCLELTASFCTSNGGTYQGDNTVCWPNPCISTPPGWSENFDSYANGTILYNVGGWTGWDNSPAAAGEVSALQAHSTPHSIAVKGTTDAIHPFAGVEGGQWVLTAWQYIPSNLSSMTYFVVNSYYQHGGPYYWTVELHFDPTTGLVTDALRDLGGSHPLPVVYDQWVEIRLVIDLSGGLGWIDQYYNGQLLLSGNWIVGAIGQLAIGNIDLYAPHPETVYYDDLSLVNPGPPPAATRPLFAGVQYGNLPTRTTNLAGFPNVTWLDGFIFGVNGAAGRPDGTLYLSSGDFNSELYLAPVEGPALYLCDLQEDVSGLGYGRGRLFGFCNYASPMGIYEINPSTGNMTLLAATGSRRFFGLDYNAADGLLYGYDEYGSPSGLCSINIATGQITFVAPSVPAGNSAARGLACGYNKVYAVTVYGADYPMYAYDLAQGPGGTWVPMTHPYPDSNSTSGAAWVPGPVPGDMNCDGALNFDDIDPFVLALSGQAGYEAVYPDCYWRNADCNLDGQVNFDDINAFVALLSGS
jgi:hypothetical protein